MTDPIGNDKSQIEEGLVTAACREYCIQVKSMGPGLSLLKHKTLCPLQISYDIGRVPSRSLRWGQ